MLKLKNIGTDKACQFRLSITGIPNECLRSGPLPYLYPGGVSTVGFTISHLMTKPAPGFHTVSINLQAPEEYYGEVLEFNQDIYVVPVFKNELILEDDSDQLTGFNQTMKKEQQPSDQPEQDAEIDKVRETARMIPGQAVNEEPAAKQEEPPVIVSGDAKRDAFSDAEEEPEETPQRRRRKPEKVLVIHHDDELERTAFADPAPADEKAPDETEQRAPVTEPEAAEQPSPSADSKPADDASSEPEAQERAARKRKKTTARKKVADTGHTEKTEAERSEASADISDKAEPDKDAAAAEPAAAAAPDGIPEMTGADDAVPEPSDVSTPSAEENVPEESSALPEDGMNDGTVTEPEPETAESEEDRAETDAEPDTDAAVPAEEAAAPASGENVFADEPQENDLSDMTDHPMPETPQPEAGHAADDAAADIPEPAPAEPETESLPAEEVDLPAVSEEVEVQEPEAVPAAAEEAEAADVAEDAEEIFRTVRQEEAAVVKHKDGTIPVVYGNQSFDFDDGSPAEEPSEQKPVAVRFVKGGSFGD